MEDWLRKVILWFIGLVAEILLYAFLAPTFGSVLNMFSGMASTLTIQGVFGLFIMSTMVAIIGSLIYMQLRKTKNLDYRFKHLRLEFSRTEENPRTSEPHKPVFVVNLYAKQAYYLSDLIRPYVKRIASTSHDSEQILKQSLRKQKITINERKEFFPEELNLWIRPDGEPQPQEKGIDSATLQQLKEFAHNGKFKKLQIAYIYPWYCWTRSSMESHCPPDKRLLIDFSTPERIARPAPAESHTLTYENILKEDSYTKLYPFMSLPRWCKHYKYKFDRQPYDLSELLFGEKPLTNYLPANSQ